MCRAVFVTVRWHMLGKTVYGHCWPAVCQGSISCGRLLNICSVPGTVSHSYFSMATRWFPSHLCREAAAAALCSSFILTRHSGILCSDPCCRVFPVFAVEPCLINIVMFSSVLTLFSKLYFTSALKTTFMQLRAAQLNIRERRLLNMEGRPWYVWHAYCTN